MSGPHWLQRGAALSGRLLVVEDDATLRTGLRDALASEGYDVTVASDGAEGRALLASRHFDLAILDLMLPKRGGLEILRELRQQGQQTPVLVLTARGDESDKVLGLELGADDYVTKPFGLRELVARVAALLRRTRLKAKGAAARVPDRFRIGTADVDLAAFRLVVGGVTHTLSPKEAAMLALLYAEAGKAVSRERFLDEVWGSEQFVGPRTIDTHMLNLRHKLEADPKHPRFVKTIHGVGYRLDLDG